MMKIGKFLVLTFVWVVGAFLLSTPATPAAAEDAKRELNAITKVNPAAPLFGSLSSVRPKQPTFKKPESARKKLPPGTQAPAPPQAYFCDVQDYTSGIPAMNWTIPDAYGDDLFNMRFTADADYECTLYVAHYLMNGTMMTGTPDMRCYLWDDNGFGFPGNKLDSVDIPYATLLANTVPLGYVSADFYAGQWIFSNGEEHHCGWTILQSGPGDTLAIVSDSADGPHAGEERASEYWSGMWETMLNDWGIDVSFFILNERCCYECCVDHCYWQSFYTNIAYAWKAPHPTQGDVAYAQRFSVDGPETLKFVDVYIYDPGDGSFGNDEVYITAYSDTNGLPGVPIAPPVAMPAGTYPAFPAFTTFSFPPDFVVDLDIHLAFSSSAATGVEYESCLSSDGTDGVGRSSCDTGGGNWVDMLSRWGMDVNFVFDAYMCRDPYAECFWNWCYSTLAYFWRLPDAWGDVAQAQKFSAEGPECRVGEVKWYLYDNGTPTAFTTNSKVSVYSDAGGLPGTELASIILDTADYVFYPAPTVVDFEPLSVTVSEDYWVAIESFGTDSTDGIRVLSDSGGGGCHDSYAELALGAWWLIWEDWDLPWTDIAGAVEVEHCCIPETSVTEITLDHVDGIWAGDTVVASSPIRCVFRLTYMPGDTSRITGSANGFRVYERYGGNFYPVTGDTLPHFSWSAKYDGGFFINTFSVTGTGADTISFGGYAISGPGVVNGTDDTVWYVTTGSDNDGDTLCIDSSFYPPGGEWLWATTAGVVFPAWYGPYCFHVHKVPDSLVKPGMDLVKSTRDDPKCRSFDLSLKELPVTVIDTGFFGPGSDPYACPIEFVGCPLKTTPPDSLGETDALIERLDTAFVPDCPSSDTVDIMIRALCLVSAEPITVTYDEGAWFELWQARVCLSKVVPQDTGMMIINRKCVDGGTFNTVLPVTVRYIFERVDPPPVDTPLVLDSLTVTLEAEGYWMFEAPAYFSLITLDSTILVDHDCDSLTPDTMLTPSGGFAAGMRAVPCDCDNESKGAGKTLTREEETWAAHGFLPSQEPVEEGACCLPDASCLVTTQEVCEDSLEGIYLGDTVHCDCNACDCCENRGDADHNGSINVADLTYLVEYLFFNGPAPPCLEEADVDSDGSINVADLTALVDYLFFDPCPFIRPCP